MFPCVFKKIDINGYGLFYLVELRLYFPLDVQRQCSEWITLATTNFRIVWAKNLPNPRDRAPLTLLNTRNEARTFFVLAVFCNLSLDFHSSYCSITFIFPLSVLSSFFHTHCFQLVCGTALAGLAAPLAPFCPLSPLLP